MDRTNARYPAALPPGDWDITYPDRSKVDSWSLTSMNAHLRGLDRYEANRRAKHADELYQALAARLHREPIAATRRLHMDIVTVLARAEEHAPGLEREVHAARLDGYTAFFGLRGWYRYLDRHDEHRVAVNYLRTATEGDTGRWFFYKPIPPYGNRTMVSIVDRDSGLPAARVHVSCGNEWIRRMEAGQPVTGPACGRDTCTCTKAGVR